MPSMAIGPNPHLVLGPASRKPRESLAVGPAGLAIGPVKRSKGLDANTRTNTTNMIQKIRVAQESPVLQLKLPSEPKIAQESPVATSEPKIFQESPDISESKIAEESPVEEDLSPNKCGGILRQIIEHGDGDGSPNYGDLVNITLEGRVLNSDEVFDTRKAVFRLGFGNGINNNICEGIEKALRHFKRTETSRVTIQPQFAFKSKGNKKLNVPPNTTLQYIVKLNHFYSNVVNPKS